MKRIAVANPDKSSWSHRLPQHEGAILHGIQQLTPFFCAPLRPNESLDYISLRGFSSMLRFVNVVRAPMSSVELAVWRVPLTTMAHWMAYQFSTNADETTEYQAGTRRAGSGVQLSNDPIDEQGQRSVGLQRRMRRWAGEISDEGVLGVTSAASAYMPYTSFSTWVVGKMFYDLNLLVSDGYEDDDLYQTPPLIDDRVRSPLMRSTTLQTEDDNIVDSAIAPDSLVTLGEKLSLMSQAEMTYAEVLGAYGVPPGLAAAMPELLLHRRQNLRSGTPQLMSGVVPNADGAQYIVNSQSDHGFGDLSVVDGAYTMGNLSPMGVLDTSWNLRRDSRIWNAEHSVILGTMCYYVPSYDAAEYAHHMAVNRLTNRTHWGIPSMGGVEEMDFLAGQRLYNVDGTALQIGEYGQSGVNAMNMANLYLHGDNFTNNTDYFRFVDPAGNELGDQNAQVASQIDLDMAIHTDMMSG